MSYARAAPASSLARPKVASFRPLKVLSFGLMVIVSINLVLVLLWFRRDETHKSVPTSLSQKPRLDHWAKKQGTMRTMPKSAKKDKENATTRTMDLSRRDLPTDPVVIGHVVSLIKCSKTASVTGFLDAAAVLRHSIHQQSVHTTASHSKYSYRMYAIVHQDCEQHAPVLRQWGYTPLVKQSPVTPEQIRGEFLRTHIESENCCGSKEFIKLYAYTLTQHPIVVHWDLDVAVLHPMDDLFDAMLFPYDSVEGKRARSALELQHPTEPLPETIDAFLTRDITSSRPWEKVQGVQGGFLVARPNPKDLKLYVDIIQEGNYSRGRDVGTGWGNLGYGGFQGAMAYQGIVAYFYDQYKPRSAVELNVCRWNQVVADVIWRGPLRMQHHMQCREYPKDGNFDANTKCEDCRVTPTELVKTVHYTACKKPWECVLPHPRKARDPKEQYRINNLTNITTCGKLFPKWFDLRRDFEQLLERRAGVKPSQRDGTFQPDSFLGYCSGPGGYIPMNPPPQNVDMSKLYGLS